MGTGERYDPTERAKQFQTSPGQYNPDDGFTKQKGPQYRFGNESRPQAAAKNILSNPGPAEYNIASRMNEGPKSTMAGRNDKEGSGMKLAPGPGHYST